MIERIGTVLLIGASIVQAACSSNGSLERPTSDDPEGGGAPVLTRDVSIGAESEPSASAPRVCLETDTGLPAFPWPPPKPSTMVKLVRALLLEGLEEDKPTLGTVSARLETALGEAGYREYSFHAIGCDGFALITALERTDGHGRPLAGSRRWYPPDRDERWSLRAYIARLFYAEPGHYRQIIFAATDEPYDSLNLAEAPTREQLHHRVKSGRTSLPAGDDVSFGPEHELHILIYEFRKDTDDEGVEQVSPSLIGWNEHLAEIYAALEGHE